MKFAKYVNINDGVLAFFPVAVAADGREIVQIRGQWSYLEESQIVKWTEHTTLIFKVIVEDNATKAEALLDESAA